MSAAWQVIKVGNRTIRAKDHRSEIIVALRSDLAGAVLKPTDRLRIVSRTIPTDCPLTPLQLDILKQLGRGLSYKEIAAERNRSLSTIRTHVWAIYKKLGIHDRAQAVLKAVGEGWL